VVEVFAEGEGGGVEVVLEGFGDLEGVVEDLVWD